MCILCQIDPVNAGNGNHDELVKSFSQTPTPGTSTTSVPGVGDIPGDATTTAEVKVGGRFTGTIEAAGDTDWIKVTLEAGKRYVFSLDGIDDPSTDNGALYDPFMEIYDANGNRVAADDDGGDGRNAQHDFVPSTSGTYYVKAAGFQYFTGDYRLTVAEQPQPQDSLEDLANYLTRGFFFPLKFNLGSDGTNPKNGVITYTLDGHNQDKDGIGQRMAELFREAFRLFEAILGIDFQETSSETADIRVSDNRSGAFAWSSYRVDRQADNSQGYIGWSLVNISSDWGSGADVGSGLFITILHEIGHALGLGHQGPYNGSGVSFRSHAKFWNDSNQLSMMSYFNQTQNPNIDASLATPLAPMAVDLIALNNLYREYGFGTSGAFAGDTVWGFNTNIDDSEGKAFSQLSKYAHRTAFTIIDSGGTDTVDFSGYSADQVIDLTVTDSTNPYATASSVGGLRGNMMLAAGTVIENAIGGSGDDVIIGNAEVNVLTGNAGNDRLVGGAGDDTLTGGAGRDRFVYATADTGHDTITDFTGGEDRIDFRDLAITFADLTVVQGSGADAAHTVISWTGAGGGAQSITLENIQASSIGEADFLFGDPLEVSIANVEVWEGKTIRVTVSLNRPSWKDVTVWWQTADGTAGSGDYVGQPTKRKITFKPGETSKVIEIETADDDLQEKSESFSVTLSDPQNADLAPDPTATVTIRDDDSYPTVSVADAAVTEGGTAQVTVSLDRPYSKDVTVWWQAADGTAGSGDYVGQPTKRKITFKPGETSKTIAIDTTQDSIHEGSEYFIVMLSDPENAELGYLISVVTIEDNDPVPQVSVADATVTEGGTAQVTVSLDRPSSTDITVWWQASDGTAGSGDHSGPSAKTKVTFKAGETSKTIEIGTVDDAVRESDETFTVALSDPSGATLGTDSTATVTIRDNDVVPEISVADATVTEGGTARVTVSLDRPSSKDITVWWQTADGTAGSGDYAGSSTPQQIRFRAGETSKTIEIDTLSDLVQEGSESFTVLLSHVDGANFGQDWTATVTIKDEVLPEITVADATVTEGGTAQVRVSLDRASSKDITVWWQASDGTAGSGDHSGPSAKTKVTFKAGETSKVIEIGTTDDAIHEGSESFTVTLSDPTGATLGTDPTATVTITDNDPVPQVSVADATVTEGGTAQVTVSLDHPSSTDITVWWQASDGTAGSGDHSGPSAKTKVTFKAGETSKTIEIGTTDDAIREGDETFTVTLSDPTGATLGTDPTATVTITDNDPVPQVSVADATVTEGGTAQVTVSLDRPSSTDITVWWQTADGTATSGGPSAKTKVTFKAGETSKVIEIGTTQDAIHEGSETFRVALSDPSGATLGTDSTATVTITDDDPMPEITIADATVAEGSTAQVRVSLDRASSKDITVWWQASDGTAGSGDHSGPSAKTKVTFKAGETSKVIEIGTTDDAIHEGSESFTVTLSDPTGATLETDPTATVTITDNDPVPQVSVADATVTEGGTAQVTVSLDHPSSTDITVWWQASDGTAGSGDHSGPSAKTKVTFKAGETSKTIEIGTTDDAIREGDETFTVTLSDPTGATLGTDPTATVTITDDDPMPEITIADATVAEGGTAQVTVSLNRSSSKDITVWWQASDGTAGSGDHSGPTKKQKITFKAGETSKVIEIGTTDDAIHEGSESFTVALSDPSGAALGTDSTATVTITDNDPVPQVSVADATVTEGGTAQVTISLDRASTKDITVWWQASDGTAGSGDHSGPSAKRKITFKPGETSKTIEIGTVDDTIREGDETFTVSLSGPSGATLGTDSTATVTITDDDPDGGSGADRIVGGHGDDRIHGRGGDDHLRGGHGDDLLQGGSGDDQLDGGRGEDRLHGDRGDDRLHGGKGADHLHGGRGEDHLEGGRGADFLHGGDDDDTLHGGRGADMLEGGNGWDRLFGGGGADVLDGGAGADELEGGSGNDRLRGGGGWDWLSGGSGRDTFVYDKRRFGEDWIADFQDGVDKLDFRGSGIGWGDISVSRHFVGTSAEIRIEGANDSIVLEGVDIGLIDQNDFIF